MEKSDTPKTTKSLSELARRHWFFAYLLADLGFLFSLLAGVFGVVSPTLRTVSLSIAVVMLAVSVWIFLQGTIGRKDESNGVSDAKKRH